MFEVFARSWEITKLSLNVIKKDKELLLFPFFAGLFSIMFLVAMLVPSIIISFIEEGVGPEAYGIVEYTVLFLTYLGLSFISTFFNVCVVYTTKIRFEGGNATFGESIKFALSKIGLIFYWSFIVAIVGLVMRIIEKWAEKADQRDQPGLPSQRSQLVSNYLTSIFGMMWSIITIFVIPAMVYHDLRPKDAIKKSVETLKRTWGESLIRYYGLGLIQFTFIILGIIVLVLLFIIANSLYLGIIVIAILYIFIIMLVFSLANTVFNTALYVYADTGKIPEGYHQEIMSNAFKRRNNR